MPLFVSIILLFSGLFIVFAMGVLFDRLVGAPLHERVKVTGHKFVPTHLQMIGNAVMRVPDRWILSVENSNGRGVVAVPQPMYEETADGEIIQVSGKRGCLSKKWHLQKMAKDDEPFGFGSF